MQIIFFLGICVCVARCVGVRRDDGHYKNDDHFHDDAITEGEILLNYRFVFTKFKYFRYMGIFGIFTSY